MSILEQFADQIETISPDPLLSRLADHIRDWRQDATTVEDLRILINRYIGNIWLQNQEDHDKLWSLWQAFEPEINGIQAMTMNERLGVFGLFSRWEAMSDDAEKQLIYGKVLAKP